MQARSSSGQSATTPNYNYAQKGSSNAHHDQSRGITGKTVTMSNYNSGQSGYHERSSKTYQNPPRSSYHAGASSKIPIVAIGNPGGGKSTILNSLAGKRLFESGISVGGGLTSHLDEKKSNGQRFIDTPGVADEEYRDAAGDALMKVFHGGGPMKILFFITQQTGSARRVVVQDIATMKLVLESVPEIGRNYGIIVNKVPRNVASQLSEKENLKKFALTLYTGIGDEFKHDNILQIPVNDKLNNLDNVLVDPSNIHPSLRNFVDSIPKAQITAGRITKVCVNEFDSFNKQIEDLESKLKKNHKLQTKKMEKLHSQTKEAERERSISGSSSKIPIVAIGNPGGGKSTILNSLAGKRLFESGISVGSGLTSHLDVKEANGRMFIDTPGVADDTYRDAAGDALSKVFHNGGRMKILFFITQQTGRVVVQDIATMKLVLESVPEIGRNYGIIVNKVPRTVVSHLSEIENLQKFALTLYTGIGDEFKHDNILPLPVNDKLSNIDNVLVNPSDIHPSLLEFIDCTIPEAQITPGKVTKVYVNEFDSFNKQIEDLESELRNNQKLQTDELEKLHSQLQEVEKARNNKQKKDQKRYKNKLATKEENVRKLQEATEKTPDVKQMEEIKPNVFERVLHRFQAVKLPNLRPDLTKKHNNPGMDNTNSTTPILQTRY